MQLLTGMTVCRFVNYHSAWNLDTSVWSENKRFELYTDWWAALLHSILWLSWGCDGETVARQIRRPHRRQYWDHSKALQGQHLSISYNCTPVTSTDMCCVVLQYIQLILQLLSMTPLYCIFKSLQAFQILKVLITPYSCIMKQWPIAQKKASESSEAEHCTGSIVLCQYVSIVRSYNIGLLKKKQGWHWLDWYVHWNSCLIAHVSLWLWLESYSARLWFSAPTLTS